MIIKKAVTFRASSIGDCLMAKYLMENIHAQFPEAKCAIVVASRSGMIKDLFKAYPWLEVIEANRRNLRSIVQLWRAYRKSDLVVTQYAGKKGGKFSLASKFMARCLARCGGLVGFQDAFPWNSLLFSKILPVRSDRAVMWHEQEVLRSIGVPVSIQFPKLSFVKNNQVLERYRLEKGKFVIVHLFAGGAGRGISQEKKKELLSALAEKNPDIQIVVSGGAGDKKEVADITRDLRVQSLAGETSLQELMNLISESRGVVSVDTGVAHIATQLGRPLVLLRTCVAPNWWFSEQYGSQAPITVLFQDEVCKNGHIYKDYPECINSISIETVQKAFQKLLMI